MSKEDQNMRNDVLVISEYTSHVVCKGSEDQIVQYCNVKHTWFEANRWYLIFPGNIFLRKVK